MSVTTTTTSASTAIANNQNHIIELRQKIWQIAENRLSKVKTEEFTEYVGYLFFYRFISENLTYYLNKLERRFDPDFDYTELPDRKVEILQEQTLKTKGFFIPPSYLFGKILKKIKKDPYFIPDASFKIYDITVSYYTFEEINSKDDVTDVNALINIIFDKVYYNTYSALSPTEKLSFKEQWFKLFKPIYRHFPKLDDPLPFVRYKKEQVPELIRIIKKKNKKLIEIMKVVAKIPIEDFVKETSDYGIKEILEIQEEITGKWTSNSSL